MLVVGLFDKFKQQLLMSAVRDDDTVYSIMMHNLVGETLIAHGQERVRDEQLGV